MNGELDDGRAARDEGMDRVLDNTTTAWREAYRAIIEQRFAQFPVGKCFLGEGLRDAAKRMGLREPHHHNAWSANAASFIRRWLKEGRIVVDGMDQAKSINTHAHFIRRYRKLK